MSLADGIFIKNCRDILQNGFSDAAQPVRARWADGTPAHTVKRFAVVNRYDLSKEFPIITLRRTALKTAVKELLWIWQKKSNSIRDLDAHIWDEWADENGSIGKAYGYQLGIKHRYPEGEFDQVDRVLYDLRHNPYSRRIITNIYNHADLSEMRLYPCAYSVTFNVTDGRLNAVLNQRSQDMLTANNWNVCQYAVLVHMFAQVSGLGVGELVHVIADAHIYDRHIPIVEELLKREPYDAPQFYIDGDVTDFYKFTKDSVHLENYRYHELGCDIPVAIQRMPWQLCTDGDVTDFYSVHLENYRYHELGCDIPAAIQRMPWRLCTGGDVTDFYSVRPEDYRYHEPGCDIPAAIQRMF